jgi:hypothetical protein
MSMRQFNPMLQSADEAHGLPTDPIATADMGDPDGPDVVAHALASAMLATAAWKRDRCRLIKPEQQITGETQVQVPLRVCARPHLR